MTQYPSQVKALWVDHKEVIDYLFMSDYGLLIREQSVTNKVASPVKFAEYLSCGLPVLISENLGDYTSFVKANGCGQVIVSDNSFVIHHLTMEEREKNILLANIYFNKHSEINSEKYNQLLRILE